MSLHNMAESAKVQIETVSYNRWQLSYCLDVNYNGHEEVICIDLADILFVPI